MSGQLGWGILVQMATVAAPNVFTTLDKVYDVTFPEAVYDDVEVTHYQSPNRRREFIAGLGDSGEFEFSMNHIPNSATDVYLRAALGDQRVVKVSFANGTSITFTANIKQYNPDSVPVDDKMTAVCGGKLSGDPVWGAAAAPVNSLLPSISGVLTNGQTLTVNEGTWSSAFSYTYQWRRAGVNIGGATNKTYVLIGADVGQGIDCIVTATNTTGTTPATSARTANVA